MLRHGRIPVLAVFLAILIPPAASSQANHAGPYNGYAFGIGDVDQDGVADYFGDLSGRPAVSWTYSGRNGRRLWSIAGSWGTHSRATRGDVNGDGAPDLITGSPTAAKSFPPPYLGTAPIVSGKDGKLLRRHWGTNDGDEFGYAVAFLGDVNNDKHDDYAVSVRRQGKNAKGRPEVHTFDGKTGKLLSTGTVFDPIDQLRRLGDVNGDGRLDVLGITSKKGKKVLLLSVAPQSKGLYSSVANTYDIRTFWADGPLDAGLDVNKDGAADFVLGFPSNSSTDGQVFVYSAKDGKLIHTLKPQASSPKFGSAVALVDDLNGDGHADILVGDPSGPIPNWYYFGIVQAYSGRTGELLFTIAERKVSTVVLGTGISVIGDLNGDKLPEVAIARKDGWVIYDLKVGGPYGQGCGSSTTPPSLRTDLPPRIAGTFALDATNLLANTSGVLVVGLSDKLWGTRQLPLGLGFMGMPSCQLLCSWDAQLGFSTATGRWQPRFKMPKDFNLLGVPVYNQLWALDSKANFPGIATSNAVRNFVKQ